jgi:hypothetical protein
MHKVLIGPQGQATLFCEAPDKFRAQQLAGKYAIALRRVVTRARESNDRCYVRVALTAQGRKIIAKIFPDHATRVADEMGVLGEEEQEQLGRLCRKLGRGTRSEAASAAGKRGTL